METMLVDCFGCAARGPACSECVVSVLLGMLFFSVHKLVIAPVLGLRGYTQAVAEGRFDAYPRSGPISEWDTAAGQAVLEAAGGRVLAEDGKPLAYGKPGFVNGPFVAIGG